MQAEQGSDAAPFVSRHGPGRDGGAQVPAAPRGSAGAPAAPEQPLQRAAAEGKCWAWDQASTVVGNFRGRVSKLAGEANFSQFFLFLYLRTKKIVEMSWIPGISHSLAAGHRPWPSVQVPTQPFKFQLCPQEWLQKKKKKILPIFLFTVSILFPYCAEFVNCSSTSPSPGPAQAHAHCPWQFLALISCAAPQLAGCSSRDKTPPALRLPRWYNFVWKEKTGRQKGY